MYRLKHTIDQASQRKFTQLVSSKNLSNRIGKVQRLNIVELMYDDSHQFNIMKIPMALKIFNFSFHFLHP